MEMTVITNNPELEALAPKGCAFQAMEGRSAREVLQAARDRIHLGAKLLAHPMAGRLRPNETPYMTAILQEGPGGLDLQSLEIIEYCLAEEAKYAPMRKKYDDALLPDLRFISGELFQSILRELG